MAKTYNLIAIVVFITLIEGLAVYINIIVHPECQPALTAFIVSVATIANGIRHGTFLKYIHTFYKGNIKEIDM